MSEKEILEIKDQCKKIIYEQFGYTKGNLISIDINVISKKISINIWDKSSYKSDPKYLTDREEAISAKIAKITGFSTSVSL